MNDKVKSWVAAIVGIGLALGLGMLLVATHVFHH